VPEESALWLYTDGLWVRFVGRSLFGVRIRELLHRSEYYWTWALVHGKKIVGINLSFDEYNLIAMQDKE